MQQKYGAAFSRRLQRHFIFVTTNKQALITLFPVIKELAYYIHITKWPYTIH